MEFIQPYFNRAQQVVKYFSESVKESYDNLEDNLEQGFDKIWSKVEGSGFGKWLGDVFDINTSGKVTPMPAHVSPNTIIDISLRTCHMHR